jgi:endonuclease-8
VLRTPRWNAVGFALGVVALLARDDEDSAVGHLGPDLLGPDWDAGEAVQRLMADPDRPLNEALLDQRNLAGIGNLYANELSFISGRHPRSRVGDVPDLPRLVMRAAALLRANRERSEQATTGDIRRGHTTWVYRRERAACRRCGTRIEVAMTGPPGRERATYWCPACQPS